ncbi:sulfotransferase [Thioclava sp. 'Guangxiensis']|uniref:sulfotransferase n=1 Tax=Thioclava sp. 'Guangxiensis' TaxID=3149044 RepID=UPI00387802C7
MLPKFLICGMEHTGTTLISDLFRQVAGLDSGFECGALLRDTPQEFNSLQPFRKHMNVGWGITDAQMDDCCESPDFETFYSKLQNYAANLSPDTKIIFDKTPRYLSELTAVLGREKIKTVASFKDPRGIVFSDFKRSKQASFDEWYPEYKIQKIAYTKKCYQEYQANSSNPLVCFVSLEDLALNSRQTMERMFSHVDEKFRLEYAIISEIRFQNTKNRTVSADIAFEHNRGLTAAQKSKIETDFSFAEDWFYK